MRHINVTKYDIDAPCLENLIWVVVIGGDNSNKGTKSENNKPYNGNNSDYSHMLEKKSIYKWATVKWQINCVTNGNMIILS